MKKTFRFEKTGQVQAHGVVPRAFYQMWLLHGKPAFDEWNG